MAAEYEAKLDFESSLKELAQIVEQLEKGGLTLEDSLHQFERGINLTRLCQTALKNAEQKVSLLLEQNNQEILQPYNSEENQ